MGPNSKTQNVKTLKNSKCDKTQKLTMWQKLKNLNVSKLIIWKIQKHKILPKSKYET